MTELQIKHHLTDEILLGYSTGTLPEAFDLLVATHVSMCDACRAAVEAFDAMGGALIEDDSLLDDVAALSDESLAATLALIETLPEDITSHRKPGTLPGPVQDYVGGDLEAVKWRPVGMGVKQAILKTTKDATARLLFIPKGGEVPQHSHNGLELTLVLKGAFSDDEGHFGPGDVEIADGSTLHTPVADPSEDCICLAVTDASLKFQSLLPRLMQPFIRI